jgi:gamma-glutamylcyclotransferase (GGCT)/AIG2-like uncharacterized protein YtfP|tara:strand:+ start:1929 stop:2417 length:489 start_codon:yes stop_codon:yes gene_type:complete
MADRKQEKEVKYYFAYGSNMNHEHMKFRCPKAKFIETYTLPGYELVFRSVADVQQSKDSYVTGALFEITDDCEKSLDVYEGYPHLYTKKYVNKWHDDMNKFLPQRIMFYSMVDKHGIYPPSQGYFLTIKQGYKDCNLPTEPLMIAAKNSIVEEFELPNSLTI